MPNPTLDEAALLEARTLIEQIEKKIELLSAGDSGKKFAFRRKIAKELIYLERSKPSKRKRLKKQKWKAQEGKCADCKCSLELRGSILDRKHAILGYNAENVDLVCTLCDRKRQDAKSYA